MIAPVFDTHVNLHHHSFSEDRAEVIARARAAGVARMITICDRLTNAADVRAVAEQDAQIWASVGVHPHHAKDYPSLSVADLVTSADHPKIVGIGESGLDLHYQYSPIEQQIAAFQTHIAAARQTGLVLIVHTRDADDLMADILEQEMAKGRFKLLLHCYTSGADLARRALALGAYISFSGIMTFKNAGDVRAVAAATPLERIVIETDCPYLAPVPHRGRRCEPAFAVDVARAFLALRGIEEAQGREILWDNTHRLFDRVAA
jgi:TatD DNase family protein